MGVYISRIEEGSLAERSGLRPGDTILEVNGTPFTSVSHEEALKVSPSFQFPSPNMTNNFLHNVLAIGNLKLLHPNDCVSPARTHAHRFSCNVANSPPHGLAQRLGGSERTCVRVCARWGELYTAEQQQKCEPFKDLIETEIDEPSQQ